eukprot:2101749-Rhodomonas_salina.4
MRFPVLTQRMVLPGCDLAHASARSCSGTILPMVLSVRYGASGTDVGHADIIRRTHYAMSGTDVGYAATRLQRRLRGSGGGEREWRCCYRPLLSYALAMQYAATSPTVLCTRCAKPNTDMGYAATRRMRRTL